MITRTATILFVLLQMQTIDVHAGIWNNLWQTKNQQGHALMKKNKFHQAEETFVQPDWKAAAAYRAGHYEQAANLYRTLNTDDAFYNQGNALAHMGQYENAIEAYDKAIAINPNHKDAHHNRELVDALLKKDQQQKNSQQKDQQQKDAQQKDAQQKDSQQKDSQQKDSQQKDSQQKDSQQQDSQQKDSQQQDSQQQDSQQKDSQQKDAQQKDPQQKDSQQKDSQQKDSQQKDQPQKDPQPTDVIKQTKTQQEKREKQQAKEQWLRLVPDDPGGLMREKFLRDHLRRQRGWYD